MVLGFKKQFPDLIMKEIKIHSIREDTHRRWYKGRKIHFATGSRTKNYNKFRDGECKGVQAVAILWKSGVPVVYIGEAAFPSTANQVALLAKNDGFESTEDFFKWFNKEFRGWIIHWTDFKY
ncbi:hypothetical protein LCGC14_1745450 [marine sediment metagenome]|uniref:Uncharacterized protein n=1 Tax=marine sediment metagenome TaxID=412755 RepID=A0A0F9H5E9_9ZZZZ